MRNDIKHLPPKYVVEDMPVDVALVQSCQSLNQNINKYSGKQGAAFYINTASGVVSHSYSGASAQNQYLCTLAYQMPVVGNKLDVAQLAYVSATSRFDTNIFIFDENTPYIKSTADLQTYLNDAIWITNSARNNLSLYWFVNTISISDWPSKIQIVLGCKNTSGISANYFLFCASANWRYANE